MIQLITRETLETQFTPKVVAGLSRALTKTTLGEYWDIPSLVDHLVNLQVFCFHQLESGYSCVFQVNSAPLKKVLHIFWAGKDPENDVPCDWKELDQYHIAIAQLLGCSQIILDGRKGWEKIGAPMGYVEDSRTYIKEVPDELSPL